jgi:hypothetical protein
MLLRKYLEATKEDVKKKMNALRTNFRKELKKVVSINTYIYSVITIYGNTKYLWCMTLY